MKQLINTLDGQVMDLKIANNNNNGGNDGGNMPNNDGNDGGSMSNQDLKKMKEILNMAKLNKIKIRGNESKISELKETLELFMD